MPLEQAISLLDLEKESFLATVEIRVNDAYVLYDHDMKKFINFTYFYYEEDQRDNPFTVSSREIKTMRVCEAKDFQRIDWIDYYNGISAGGSLVYEHCPSDWKNLHLLRQKSNNIFGYFKISGTECDPNNLEGVVCETDPDIIRNFINSLEVEIYIY